MKNLFKNAFYIALFIVSGIVFQISCSNSDNNATDVVTNKLIFLKANTSGVKFYTCNYDGSNQAEIPLVIPSNIQPYTQTISLHLSPDGQKFFFLATNITTNAQNVYSCDIDGTNLQEIVINAAGDVLALGNAN